MLPDRSVCPVCPALSVTLVYCGQAVGRMKMALGVEVGLGPGHTVLDGNPPLPKGAQPATQFSAHACCAQTAGWIKMPLGREVRLGPGDVVLDGDPPSSHERGTAAPTFRPVSLVAKPSSWMDDDATKLVCRYASPRQHCV